MEEDFAVLAAEATLAKALGQCEAPRAGTWGAAAAQLLRQSSVFGQVSEYVRLYDTAMRNLMPTYMDQRWDRPDAKLFIGSESGASCFDYRLIALIDQSLRSCMGPHHERDLMQAYQPMFVEPHRNLQPPTRHHAKVRTLSSVLSFSVETVFELARFVNRDFGFLAEVVRSDFPQENISIPAVPLWGRRIDLTTTNLWIPRGGRQPGTLLISEARVCVGAPIPESIMRYFAGHFADSLLATIRRGASLAQQHGSAWQQRIRADADGFYAELGEAEAAASKRRAISLSDLPTPAIFDRKWRLV